MTTVAETFAALTGHNASADNPDYVRCPGVSGSPEPPTTTGEESRRDQPLPAHSQPSAIGAEARAMRGGAPINPGHRETFAMRSEPFDPDSAVGLIRQILAARKMGADALVPVLTRRLLGVVDYLEHHAAAGLPEVADAYLRGQSDALRRMQSWAEQTTDTEVLAAVQTFAVAYRADLDAQARR